MRHIFSFSGGLRSYFALERVTAAEGVNDVAAVFCDALADGGF